MNYTIRAATQTDFPRIAEIVNAQNPGATSVEDMIRQDRFRPAGDPLLRLVAVGDDGNVLGFAVTSGGALQPPGCFRINTRVDTAFQGRGIGSALYQAAEAFARVHGATKLDTAVREGHPARLAWAELRGFVKQYHMFESVLDLATFDPAPFADAVTQVRDTGIRFTTLEAEMTSRNLSMDAAFAQYWDLAWTLSLDVPGLPADQPAPPVELAQKIMLGDPHWHPSRVVLAVDGDRWVALAELVTRPDGDLYNKFTAVRREYRGRGLSLAIKVVALAHAKTLGAPRVRTNNHSQNAPMLATNRRLGYVPEPGYFQLEKDL